VKRDVECQAGVRPAEDPWGEYEMRRAADRQELAESLDDAKDQRLEHGHRKRAKEDEGDGDPRDARGGRNALAVTNER